MFYILNILNLQMSPHNLIAKEKQRQWLLPDDKTILRVMEMLRLRTYYVARLTMPGSRLVRPNHISLVNWCS